MSAFAEVWGSVQEIEGWLTEDQARILYGAAAGVAPGQAIVEIGSHHGRSTVILGRAKPPASKLIAIDPFGDARWGGGSEALATFQGNVALHGLEGDVEHMRQFGAEAGSAWRAGSVGLLFVDGAHDYPTVDADLRAWLPHLSSNATVLMHDAYSSPGVTRAAFRHFFGARDFAFDRSSRSLVVFTRGDLGPMTRVGSGMRMLRRTAWLARNLTIKIAIRRGWKRLPRMLGHHEAAYPY